MTYGPTVTRARSFSNVESPRTSRETSLVDRGKRRLLARGNDLGRSNRADPGQRVELLARRGVDVDQATGAVWRDSAGIARQSGHHRRLAASRNVDFCTVRECLGEVQHRRRGRNVNLWRVSASGFYGVAHPAAIGQAVDARSSDRPLHIDDQLDARDGL